jgi:putative glycosyltransferase (TIGR04348 family)
MSAGNVGIAGNGQAEDTTGVVIVTPALADANNGNWQTARRWQRFLEGRWPVRLVRAWPDADASMRDRVLVALHARRSAASIAAWHERRGSQGLAVVLTGTDLYDDLGPGHPPDREARRSIDLAQALVVLQELGIAALPPEHRAKARTIFQSTTARRPLDKTPRHLRALMVGHLRAVKDPQTLFAAARLLGDAEGILVDHAGDALEPALGDAARATMAACPHYRWLGGLPHATTRRRIQAAHVLVHASRAEGGAHVVMEAARSGTPVIASRIAGNVGMLGRGYEGYFECGDAAGLAALLRRCRAEQGRPDGLLAQLAAQCAERAPLFAPEAERAALQALVADLLDPAASATSAKAKHP